MIIDLSIYKKEDLEIKSLKGTTFIIPGNFTTEFYINLLDKFEKIKKKNSKTNPLEYIKLAEGLALDILSLDKTKTVTIDTVKEEFSDIYALSALINSVMSYVGEIDNDPLHNAPMSR